MFCRRRTQPAESVLFKNLHTHIDSNKKQPDHTHLRQDLGNPGYACLTCPQEILPAPVFYPPLGVAPNFDRIAALQRQLDTVWQSIRHARYQQDLPRRGVNWQGPPWSPARTRPQIRAEIRHLKSILAGTRTNARNVGS